MQRKSFRKTKKDDLLYNYAMEEKEPLKIIPISVRLSFAKMVKIEAAKRNISMAELIRQAIRHFLETYNQ
jgi:hypothetical protein